jgi:glycosyltransferase involved in cell wall biosynthesis
MAKAAGLPSPAAPSISIVMPTRRPDQLEHALTQVRHQRASNVQLVLATHGFEPDPDLIRTWADEVDLVVRPQPASANLGEVLRAGTQSAEGDVIVKLDDDDWYGPDFLTDLLWAREVSGAEVVGASYEFIYLEADNATVRRNLRTEHVERYVAGGTIMVGREVLRAVGGWRSTTVGEDSQLFADVRDAGGRVYRGHGFNYVHLRAAQGHTWVAPDDYFGQEKTLVQRWEGFTPSRLLGHVTG